jgi:hypothetical protein
MWLRNKHRPLGELLDEGYLNRARLEWAAAKAYDPILKEAAQALLDSQKLAPSDSAAPATPTSQDGLGLQVQFDVGITMERARATLWPFRPFRDQLMGDLVEARQLSLKDLAYAFETAWHEQVRRAASALLLARLNQEIHEPEPAAGPLHVLSGGRSYPLRQQFKLTLYQGILMGAAMATSLALLISGGLAQLSTRPGKTLPELFSSAPNKVTFVLGVLLALVLVAAFTWLVFAAFDLVINQLDRRIARYRQGQEGEEAVLGSTLQTLDGDWHLFRNITLPGFKKMDIDIVLVGPPGVWVLEVKALAGEYRNIGNRWEYKAGNRWRVSRANPSRQARRSAISLARFLKADNIRQWVSEVVVWTNQESPLTVENPTTGVWVLDRLPDELGNLWDGAPIPPVTRSQIVEKLTKLCPDGDRRALATVGNQQ